MATKDKILGVLAAQGEPVTLKELSEILGEPQGNFFTQLDRMAKGEDPLVKKDENKKWLITDSGRKSLEDTADEDIRPPAEVLREAKDPTAVITEYGKFMQLGRQSGWVNPGLLKATCDHVWAQDFHDLKIVHAALIQAGVSPDVANRWTAFWGSYLKLAITPDLEEIMTGARKSKDGEVTEGKSLRDKLTHSINVDTGLPLYMGAGNGDYTYEDAKELASQFLASRSRGAAASGGGGTSTGQGNAFEQAVKIVEMIEAKKAESGGSVTPKNYAVKFNADGTAEVEEMDPTKPMVIQTKPAIPIGSGLDGINGQVTQLTELIKALANLGLVKLPGVDNGGSQIKYIYVDAEGNKRETLPGEPIVINRPAPAVAAPTSMVTIPTSDGKEMAISLAALETFFKVEDWKDKRRRDEESHQSHQELIKGIKDAVPDVIKGAQDFFNQKKEGTT